MSLPRKVHIPCPRCNTTLDVTVWDSVNTDLMSELPQKIISGEFFDHVCPKCGFVCHIEYPTLYHDMKHGAMIWIVHKDENYDGHVQEIRNSILIPGDLTRIVHTVGELREKVSLLEAGYDDRIIEIHKYLQIAHYNQVNPELDVSAAFFTYENERPKVIFECAGGRQLAPPFLFSNYENLSQILSPILSSLTLSPYAIIDQSWAEFVFTTYCQDIEKEAEDNELTVVQLIAMRALERENERLREERQAAATNSMAATSGTRDNSIKFCRKCGEKLLGDSLFCHKCGTKVIVEPATPPAPASPPMQSATKPKTVVCTPRKHRSVPKWLKPLLLGILALAAVVFFSQDYLKAAFLYDISITEKQDISMSIGDTHTIKYDADIGNLHTSDITWESSDTSIAKVSGKGVITAKGEGTATITVSINGISKDSCTVVVSLNVSFSGKETISLVVGDTHTIKYTADTGSLPSSEIVWQSSDAAIANVSQKGIVTAKNEGTATITASVNGVVRDSCTVIVSLKPVQVKNGQMIVKPRYTGYPEVTINAPLTADCFAYFENISNSANDFAFYVKAGSSATVNAPAGTYNFYYATGETWYGKDLKFGKDTNFYKSPDRIVLTEDSRGYDILELTLYVVPNGNMDTDPIDENEFPI